MMRFSLRTGLTLAFSAVSVLMAAMLSLLLGTLATDLARQNAGLILGEQARQMANQLNTGLAQRLRTVELISALRQISDPATPVADNRKLLEKLRDSDPEIAWIGLADSDGKVLVAADGLLEGASVKSRPWFAEGLRGSFVGDVHEAKLLAKLLPPPGNGEPLRFVDLATPVYGLDGQRRGVLGVHLSWEWARSVEQIVFSTASREMGVEAFLLSRENGILLAPQSMQGANVPPGLGKVDIPIGEVMRWADGKHYLTAMIRMPGEAEYGALGWRVLVRQSAEAAYSPVRALQWMVLMIGAGLAAGFALFGRWLARRITRPITHLSAAADRLRAGEADVLIPADSGFREVMGLSSSLQHLVAALKTEEAKLASLNASLEQQVADRTEALDAANRHMLLVLEERQKLVAQLEELAARDSLTRLYNRRAFHERAAVEWQRLSRDLRHLSLLVIDIDHFKRINDDYGHDGGDETLRVVAKAITEELREIDTLARFGGEEFVAMLPGAGEAEALVIAERVRSRIASLVISSAGAQFMLTASFGVAEWEAGIDITQLIARADEAMYRAKRGGRNRVEAWQISV